VTAEPFPAFDHRPQGMWRYRSLLPIGDGPIRYPLPVGGSPLTGPAVLRDRLGLPDLWVKDETVGTSGSNKDRATALVIEDGLRSGATTITTASTGNAAVATALGAAAAGIRAVIFVPAGCAEAKVAVMRSAGALVLRVVDGYRAAFELSRAAARHFGWLDRNTGVNPLTLHAKKTVAFEIWEQLGRAVPDVVVVPVGDGPTVLAMGRGFRELESLGLTNRVPRLIGVQASGCQPLAREWHGRPDSPVRHSGTIADGIDVPEPISGVEALAEVARSGGAFVAVPDAAMLAAIGMLASTAGVTCEPAGAAGLAGLLKARRMGLVAAGERVVVLVTGRELVVGADVPLEGGEALIAARLDEVERYAGALA
jgi:threonine synthase